MAQNIRLTERNTPQRYRNVLITFLQKVLVDCYYFLLNLTFVLIQIFSNFCKCNHRNRNVLHTFFISKTLRSNTSLKLAKNQAESKHHLKAELLLFESYLLTLSTLSSENNRRYCAREVCKKKVSLY